MKEKIIITNSTGDLNCLKKNNYVNDYTIISVNDRGELSTGQIEEITNNKQVNELIMILPTDQQQRFFFHKYKDVFPDKKFGFVHFLNGETIEFALDYKGQDFICELLKNRTTTKQR
jgi:hypothetical protein